MKAARFAISVFCLLIVLAFTGCSQRRNDYQLDHYKVYRASDYLDHYKVYKRYTGGELDHYKLYSATGPSQPEAVTVTLKDQFLEPSFDFIPATAEDIEYFAIPASKIMVNSTKAGRIRDSLTHLTWYKLNVEEQYQITVQVQFHNQLNDADQVWKIRGPVYLLVPTDKTERDGSASESAPRASSKRNENRHFLCYEIIEPITWIPPDSNFIIGDQIAQNEEVAVTGTKFFCTPAEKIRDGQSSGSVNPEDQHLACYWITPKEVDDSKVEWNIQNQLVSGECDELDLQKRVMLCVPSDKINWERVDNSDLP